MTTFRPMRPDDLFKFNHINLDPLTGSSIILPILPPDLISDMIETYNIPFYLQYLSTWPGYCSVIEGWHFSYHLP